MCMKLGILVLIVLGICCYSVDGRRTSSLIDDSSVAQVNNETGDTVRVKSVCSLCEKFTAQALSYIRQNKTQIEIINTLLQTCSFLSPPLKDECIKLVNYYGQVFFQEINTTQPSDFCNKMKLCNEIETVSYKDLCTLCDHMVAAALATLKDPDVKLEIIEGLMKACSLIDRFKFFKRCKTFTFKYGPIILSDMERFLEHLDVCSTIHICVAANDNENLSALKIALPLKP